MKIMGMIVARCSFRLLIVGFSVKIFRIEWSGLLLIYDSSILCTAAHKIGRLMIPRWSVQSVTCDGSRLITKSRGLISDRFLTHPLSLRRLFEGYKKSYFGPVSKYSSTSSSCSSCLLWSNFWVISISPNWQTNLSNALFCNAFVKPSASISCDGVYSTVILPVETSCRSQWLWTSTCRSFVWRRAISAVTSLIVWWLSHWIRIRWSSSHTDSSVISLLM